MIEEAEELHRRVAYLDTVRGLHRRERLIGLVGCLVGVVLLVIGRFRPGAPVWLTWAGLAVVVADNSKQNVGARKSVEINAVMAFCRVKRDLIRVQFLNKFYDLLLPRIFERNSH